MSEVVLAVCETVAAITPHLRIVTKEHPIRLSGHVTPRPRALCGVEIAWDTRSSVEHWHGCQRCIVERNKRGL